MDLFLFSDPMPRQEGIRLAKKGGFPSLLNAGFCRFQTGYPFPPASLCGNGVGLLLEGESQPFLSSPDALLPGQR